MMSAAQALEANSIPEPNSGCVLWTGNSWANGRYGVLQIRVAKRQKSYMAHRLAFELANGPIPKDMCVCHKCDVTHCINPDHLFLGTRKENMADMARKGRAKFLKGDMSAGKKVRGSRHGNAKLTEENVRAIRADSRQLRRIASDYNVTVSAISLIKRGCLWRHV